MNRPCRGTNDPNFTSGDHREVCMERYGHFCALCSAVKLIQAAASLKNVAYLLEEMATTMDPQGGQKNEGDVHV